MILNEVQNASRDQFASHATAKEKNVVPQMELAEAGRKFEQMLWSEMLRHSGLEKAFTMNGGQAVSAFSSMIVEQLAEQLSQTHPLGMAQSIDETVQEPPKRIVE